MSALPVVRVSRLVRLMMITLLIQLLICRKLWLTSLREFPTVPLIEGWAVRWGNIPDLLFYLLMLGCCVKLFISPQSRASVILLLLTFFLFVLEDVTRLQPWFFLYLLMLSGLLLCREEGSILFFFRLVLSSVYLFSGLQKLNVHFAAEFFPWLGEFTGARSFLAAHSWVAYVSAGAEAAAGILLWITLTRKVAAVIILLTHLFILLSIGPTGHRWNEVVWPWNVLFAGMTWQLFYKSEAVEVPVLRSIMQRVHFGAMILAVLVLPLLGLFGKWDHFLSDGFYSAMPSEALVSFERGKGSNLPVSSVPFQYLDQRDNKGVLFITYWALDELKVPLYPEDRVFLGAARHMAEKLNGEVTLELGKKQRFVKDLFPERIVLNKGQFVHQ